MRALADVGRSLDSGRSLAWDENGYLFKINHVLNVPFVLGISPSRPATLLVAVLRATARALKADSAL
jgi:hypothetical protein